MRTFVKLTILRRNVSLEQTHLIDRIRNRRLEAQYQVQQRNAQNNSDGNIQAATQTLN